MSCASLGLFLDCQTTKTKWMTYFAPRTQRLGRLQDKTVVAPDCTHFSVVLIVILLSVFVFPDLPRYFLLRPSPTSPISSWTLSSNQASLHESYMLFSFSVGSFCYSHWHVSPGLLSWCFGSLWTFVFWVFLPPVCTNGSSSLPFYDKAMCDPLDES